MAIPRSPSRPGRCSNATVGVPAVANGWCGPAGGGAGAHLPRPVGVGSVLAIGALHAARWAARERWRARGLRHLPCASSCAEDTEFPSRSHERRPLTTSRQRHFPPRAGPRQHRRRPERAANLRCGRREARCGGGFVFRDIIRIAEQLRGYRILYRSRQTVPPPRRNSGRASRTAPIPDRGNPLILVHGSQSWTEGET